MTARELVEVLSGELLGGDAAALARRVTTDTREVEVGDLFIALRGERFDGNEFAPAAVVGGATVAVVERWPEAAVSGAAVIRVADGLLALQRLAYWHRRQLTLPVVGITGSNGKTSTKDFTHAVLAEGGAVVATRGNLNNHIGVPLTVLSIDPSHRAAVVEMGMNHAGEIAPLCEIAMPRLGIITNIGTAHIENLGSRQAIAEEKGALARALPTDGVLFVPAGCDFFNYLKDRTKARVVPVGNGRGAIRGERFAQSEGRTQFDLVIDDRVATRVDLPAEGRHMTQNALLAAGCGWALGMDAETIGQGLSRARVTQGRLHRYCSGGVLVFDDTYNANPESMAAALETLAETPLAAGGRRYAVLGAMGELGAHGPAAHHRVGELAAELEIGVVVVGAAAAGIAEGAGGAEVIEDVDEAAAEIRRLAQAGDAVLFKASRSAAIERVMERAFPKTD